MIQLSPENRAAIRPLFADYPYLQGLVHGALSGAFGEAFADQTECAAFNAQIDLDGLRHIALPLLLAPAPSSER